MAKNQKSCVVKLLKTACFLQFIFICKNIKNNIILKKCSIILFMYFDQTFRPIFIFKKLVNRQK